MTVFYGLVQSMFEGDGVLFSLEHVCIFATIGSKSNEGEGYSVNHSIVGLSFTVSSKVNLVVEV